MVGSSVGATSDRRSFRPGEHLNVPLLRAGGLFEIPGTIKISLLRSWFRDQAPQRRHAANARGPAFHPSGVDGGVN